MQCPKCKKTPLKRGRMTARQLVLDLCSQCRGMWLDKGELTVLLGASAKREFNIPKFAVKAPDTECPRCNVNLYEFCYPGTLILVDACKQCAGVWLDNKEWKAISHARDESNKIACPKCHTRQAPAESCTNCGIIMAKYQPAGNSEKQVNASETTSFTMGHVKNESYADNIPGFKGTLLRMIDHTIKSLGTNLF